MKVTAPRNPFGRPGDDRGLWYRRRKRSRRSFDVEAIRFLRQTWDTGDEALRDAVLSFLVVSRTMEGTDILWEALASDNESLRGMAAMALHNRISAGFRPSPDQIARLIAAVRNRNRPSTKSFLLWAIEDAGYERMEELLVELGADYSPAVRFDANMNLLRRGHDTKAALLADLPELGREYDYGVERLWWERERLNLATEEEELLRRGIKAQLARRRRTCREMENPENTALFIFRWIKDGFPAEPEDIDFLAAAAQHSRSNRERLDAVRAVAWFRNDQAKEWLRRMTREPYRPLVRREARRHLQRLERVDLVD